MTTHTDSPPSFFTMNDYLNDTQPEDLITIVAKAFFMATCDRLGIEDIEELQI